MPESTLYREIAAEAKAVDWELGREEGRQEGREAGERSLLLRLLRRKLGAIASDQEAPIAALALEQLAALGEALLDFITAADLSAWLQTHSPTTR